MAGHESLKTKFCNWKWIRWERFTTSRKNGRSLNLGSELSKQLGTLCAFPQLKLLVLSLLTFSPRAAFQASKVGLHLSVRDSTEGIPCCGFRYGCTGKYFHIKSPTSRVQIEPLMSMKSVSDQEIPEALSFQQEVLDLRRRISGPEQSAAPVTLTDYADLLVELGIQVDIHSEFLGNDESMKLKKEVARLACRLAIAFEELGMETQGERLERLKNEVHETKRAVTPADGTLLDTDGDGRPDSIAVDTFGDGTGDTVIPLASNPLQRRVQEMVASTGFHMYSLGVTLTQLAVCVLADESVPRQIFMMGEILTCAALIGESGCRWWAEGFKLRLLFKPIMLLDLVNIIPIISVILHKGHSANPAFAASRLLRATRVLRLARLLKKGTSLPISEVTRSAARVAFSVLALVMVPAGLMWEIEKTANPALRGYVDALYFAITTLTTVGYGDIAPVTRLGRVIVAFQMLSAVTLIPYEVSQFLAVLGDPARISDSDVECPRCGFLDHVPEARFCNRCGFRLHPEVHRQVTSQMGN